MSLSLARQSSGDGWPLRDTAELMTALMELKARGWSGGIETAGDSWKLVLRQDGKNTVNAELGQWLVLDGDLKALTITEFQDHGYTSDPVVEFPTVDEPEPEVVEESVPFGSVTTPDVAVPVVR